jgi:predicted MFS family arabinose efflux permease
MPAANMPAPRDGIAPDESPHGSFLGFQVVTATLCRLILNTGRRFAYPFAPALSRGLGVPLTAITSVIAVMQLTGILGIPGGPLADKWGYRKMMLTAMAMMAVGLLLVGIVPFYITVMIGLFLAGFSKNIFDPAIYGFTAQRVPFSQRGRVVGVLEFAWAGSALVGIPLMGFLIEARNWKMPFWALGFSALAGFVVIFRFFPRDVTGQRDDRSDPWHTAFKHLIQERKALGLMGFVFWASMGNDQLFVVYGAWLERTFAIGVAAIGLGTSVIGAAELIGEGLTSALGDRIGLKRATILGILLAALAYGLLPLLGAHLVIVLTGLFFVFLTFEFSMVCAISLSTEAMPQYRATMMAAFLGVAGLGRVFGSLAGGPIWLTGGIGAVAAASVVASLLAAGSLIWGMAGD